MNDSAFPRVANGRALLVAALAVFVVTFVCFAPALGHGFLTNWDDDYNFLDNPAYRGLDLENLSWAFTTRHGGPYQPLSWITLGLDHELWGMDARGYHLTNNLLHATAAVLWFVVLARLIGSLGAGDERRIPLAAAFGALVFAVHPLRVESVAWITERRDVLSGALFAATLLAYLRHADERRAGRARSRAYLLAVVCFAASLLAKATAIMLPFALLCVDAARREPLRIRDKLPFAALSLGAAVIGFIGQVEESSILSVAEYGVVARGLQACFALCYYGWKTLVPVGLTPVLDGMADPAEPRFWLAALAVVGITAGAIAARGRCRGLLLAWSAFVLLALPVLGFVRVGPHLAADRYTYLPCLPWSALAAWGLVRCRIRLAGAFVVTLLGVLTFVQIGVWRDARSLWTHALRVDEENAFARASLGQALFAEGEFDAAHRHLLRAVETRRSDPAAFNTLGLLAVQRGDPEAALTWFEQALAHAPESTAIRANRDRARAALRGR